MKHKKYAILFLLLIGFTAVNAISFNDYLPGSKNYFNPDNMSVVGDNFSTISAFKIKADTTYTFSFPGYGLIEDHYVEIYGDNGSIFLEESVSASTNCIYDEEISYCTFTTDATVEYIELYFTASMFSMFYDYYQFSDFQIEEGGIVTSYEPYVPGLDDSTSPEFTGSGAFVKSYTETYLLQTIIDNHIVVMDDIDGDITNEIVIVSDEYSGNENTVGEYIVLLQATDAAGNIASFNLTVVVKDEIVPIITGPSLVTVNIDDVPSIGTIVNNNVTAIDDYDGSITPVVVTDDYTSNIDTLGEYEVIVKTVDSSMNEAQKSFNIIIEDTTDPYIESSNTVIMNQSNTKNINQIVDELVIGDNYYEEEDIFIAITSDEYTGFEGVEGDYLVSIDLTDPSGNTIEETFTVTVVDDIFPIITGPSTYSYSYTETKTLDDFKSLLAIADNVDSFTISDINVLTDEFTTRATDIGSFTIILSVTDSAGNVSTHEMLITIVDDIAPVIFIDNYIITLSAASTFNEGDALKLLLTNNELTDRQYTVKKLLDEYTGNEELPGTYEYNLKFTDDETGDEYIKEFIIKVEDETPLEMDPKLIIRNVISYTSVVGIIVFIAIKSKKTTM
ncbi:hypothetical protein OAO42_00865 [Candidatus Izimaplasma bacterium]|nr:hypothetical protein [Candidatus Izimaplasma bacterium]